MADFGALMAYTLQAFSYEFTLYGFTFSLWEVFVFGTVVVIVGRLLCEVFFGD